MVQIRRHVSDGSHNLKNGVRCLGTFDGMNDRVQGDVLESVGELFPANFGASVAGRNTTCYFLPDRMCEFC